MNLAKTSLATLALLCSAATLPAHAESSVVSSASDSVSASIGQSSNSIARSSDSSSRDRRMAQGDYKITQVAVADGRPGTLKLTLQAVDGAGTPTGADGDFALLLPEATATRTQLVAGQVITARDRPYGLEFATRAAPAAPAQPFYLVMEDAWYRELKTNAVI